MIFIKRYYILNSRFNVTRPFNEFRILKSPLLPHVEIADVVTPAKLQYRRPKLDSRFYLGTD